jgi:hypothetical protein
LRKYNKKEIKLQKEYIGAIIESSYLHTIRYKKRILFDPSRRKQKIENDIPYTIRILRILSNTVRANQYPSNLLGGQL